MKLSLGTDTSLNFIRGYSEGQITLNEATVLERSVILTPHDMIADWPPQDFSELVAEHFDPLATLAPEVVLLGTGRSQSFPHPSLTRTLVEHQIGLEVMDTAAACRTYNILMSEGRNVAAALLMIEPA